MSYENANLDLSTIDSEDYEALADAIEQHYKADNSVKSALAYHWERNHLFLDGKQWIIFEGSRANGGMWQQLQVSKANEYIPRPVTNYMFDIYQTLKSYLIQNKPRSTVTPNTQTYRDKQAAKLATIVCDTNYKRLGEDKNYEYAASCGITYGTVFKKDYWDTSALQVAKVPRMIEQPQIDPNTGAVIGYQESEVVDPTTGEIVYDELPLGDVNTCIVEPHRMAVDPLATDIHCARWIMEYAIQPIEWIKETYDKDPQTNPGYTGLVDQVTEEKTLSNSMQRFYQLRNSSGTRTPGYPLGGVSQSATEMVENAAVVKEYYERPSRKYPKGRLIVVANGITLYSGDSPYEGPDLGDWHPYSEFRWEIVPGRFWGKSPLDDVAEIQKHVNSIDAAIILTRKTMAMPQWLIPMDCGIKPGELSGRPGQEIRYRATSAPPSPVRGTPVDQSVFAERSQRCEDMKAVSGAMDILKGDRPPGVNAASALEMLFEVGTGKLRPSLDRWKVFVETSQKKQLRNISKFYREPRPEFIRMLHQKNKELDEQTINNFIGSDLYDNCNVIIEAGSNIPKLQSAEKAQLIQIAQIGTLNLQDPQNQMEFNKRLGIVGFDNSSSPDIRRAEWENDLLDNIKFTPQNKPVVLADEDHNVHIQIHLARMKEPSFINQPQEVIDAYQQHLQEHEQYTQMAEQAQQQAMAMGIPGAAGHVAGPPGNQQMPPVPQKSAGKGVPTKVASALTPDIPKRPMQ